MSDQDRKTRTKGDRVIHTVKGRPYSGNRYEGPRGLTNEQKESQRVGEKLHERQSRETGWTMKELERLGGTDETTVTKKGR